MAKGIRPKLLQVPTCRHAGGNEHHTTYPESFYYTPSGSLSIHKEGYARAAGESIICKHIICLRVSTDHKCAQPTCWRQTTSKRPRVKQTACRIMVNLPPPPPEVLPPLPRPLLGTDALPRPRALRLYCNWLRPILKTSASGTGIDDQ